MTVRRYRDTPIRSDTSLLRIHESGVLIPLSLAADAISVQPEHQGNGKTGQAGCGAVAGASQSLLVKAHDRTIGGRAMRIKLRLQAGTGGGRQGSPTGAGPISHAVPIVQRRGQVRCPPGIHQRRLRHRDEQHGGDQQTRKSSCQAKSLFGKKKSGESLQPLGERLD